MESNLIKKKNTPKLQVMVHRKNRYYGGLLLVLLTCLSFAQFFQVNASLDLRRLSEGEKQLFDTFAEDMENYFLNTSFASEASDLDLVVEIKLVIESVNQGGSQTTVNGQAIFTNQLDQYFYAKGIQFPYSKGRKMYFTPSFDPLASFFDYYAFLFIGTELDTYEYMGGTPFYNRSIELADQGKDSDWSVGWEDRWKKSRKLKKNEYLRSMRYNYFLAQSAINAEEVDIKTVKSAMMNFYEELSTLDEKLGSNKETLLFLKAYHVEIAELLAALKIEGCLELLALYDHDHKKVYESFFKN
ncbi:MAG: DUF4835 family protein [Candidatus Marinimicrobia bacterium]|jgi:hypothetical protein|nr:DUF4835 family protein [Candidatus Neomarinimicrobiota bacterium]